MTLVTMGRVRATAVHLGAACALLLGATAAPAGELSYGKPGEPVKLVVGYQPYYTESWSGIVMRGKKFYEKYLPKGSSVEFSIGLQGAVIVNAMLAGKQHIGYVGDMPAIVSTTKQDVADIRIVRKPPSASPTDAPEAMRFASPSCTSLEAVGSQTTAASILPARKPLVMTSIVWFR